MAIVAQREVAVRVLRRVVDQHQVRIAGGLARQAREVVIGPDVAVDRDERSSSPQQRQRMPHAAAGFQRRRRLRTNSAGAGPSARHRRAPAGTASASQLVLTTTSRTPMRGQLFQVPGDQRLAAGDEQRLGRGVRSVAACARRGRRRGSVPSCAAQRARSAGRTWRSSDRDQRREFRIARQHAIEVGEETRHVRRYFGLSSRWCRRAKMPMHLQVALHADPVGVAAEARQRRHRQAGVERARVVALEPARRRAPAASSGTHP